MKRLLTEKHTDQYRYSFLRNYLNRQDPSGDNGRTLDGYAHGRAVDALNKAAQTAPEQAHEGVKGASTPPQTPVEGIKAPLADMKPETLATIAGIKEWLKNAKDQIHFSKVNDILDKAGWARHEELATIHKGEGIEHALIRQLKEYKDDFGFKGRPEELNHWAGVKAHEMAIKFGYVNPETGDQIGVGTAGIDKANYLLSQDINGNPVVMQHLKGQLTPAEFHRIIPGGKTVFEGAQHGPAEYIIKGAGKAAKHAAAHAAEAGHKVAGDIAEAGHKAAEKVAETAAEAKGAGLFDWHKGSADATKYFDDHFKAFHNLNNRVDYPSFHNAAPYEVHFSDTNSDGIPEKLVMSSGGHIIGVENIHFDSLAGFQAAADKLGEDVAATGVNIDKVSMGLGHAGDRVMAIDFINNAMAKDIGINGFDFDKGIIQGSEFSSLLSEFNSHPDLFYHDGRFDVTQFKIFKELSELKLPDGRLNELLSWTQKLDNNIWSMNQESALVRLVADHKGNSSAGWLKTLFGEKLNTAGAKVETTGNGVIFRHVGGSGGKLEFNFKTGEIKVGSNMARIFGNGETFKLNNLKGAIGWLNEKFKISGDTGGEMEA